MRESVKKLNDGDVRYFRDALPRGELWRLYPDFLENAGFLDIETTGLSRDYSELTLIGVADNMDTAASFQARIWKISEGL